MKDMYDVSSYLNLGHLTVPNKVIMSYSEFQKEKYRKLHIFEVIVDENFP